MKIGLALGSLVRGSERASQEGTQTAADEAAMTCPSRRLVPIRRGRSWSEGGQGRTWFVLLSFSARPGMLVAGVQRTLEPGGGCRSARRGEGCPSNAGDAGDTDRPLIFDAYLCSPELSSDAGRRQCMMLQAVPSVHSSDRTRDSGRRRSQVATKGRQRVDEAGTKKRRR